MSRTDPYDEVTRLKGELIGLMLGSKADLCLAHQEIADLKQQLEHARAYELQQCKKYQGGAMTFDEWWGDKALPDTPEPLREICRDAWNAAMQGKDE